VFDNLIDNLYSENNNPHERYIDKEHNNLKNNKRRKLKFYEKTLAFNYYKQHIPTNMLDNEFSIEHIFPHSSIWEGILDKDRPGNLIPIISSINKSRGNRHIKYYKNKDPQGFCNFIKDIIPNIDIYDAIIKHTNKAIIINNNEYNKLCEKNENILKTYLTTYLFKL
jgi:hypothetical protein